MDIEDLSENSRRSTEELMVSYSCFACAIIVLPFLLFRFYEGDYRLALIDTLICAGLTAIGMITWVSGNVQLTRWLVCVFSMSAVIAVTYSKGVTLVYWLFPVLSLSFFLSSVRHACWISGAGVVALMPIILRDKELGEAATIISAFAMAVVVAYIFAFQTNHQRALLSKSATIDFLTGVKNRRALSQKLKESIELKKRKNESACAILLDLDHFKQTNDRFGHATGDALLVRVCNLIRTKIRLTDRLYRYGGEEFVVMLRGSTIDEARASAEKLRMAVLQDETLNDYGVTISLGVGELQSGETADQWFQRVDMALYQSKESGRNKTTLAESGEVSAVA